MTTTCPTCGFEAPAVRCVPCAERAALVESRREAMRAWLDRGLTARPVWDESVGGLSRWWASSWDGRPKPWRDFEVSEGEPEHRAWIEPL